MANEQPNSESAFEKNAAAEYIEMRPSSSNRTNYGMESISQNDKMEYYISKAALMHKVPDTVPILSKSLSAKHCSNFAGYTKLQSFRNEEDTELGCNSFFGENAARVFKLDTQKNALKFQPYVDANCYAGLTNDNFPKTNTDKNLNSFPNAAGAEITNIVVGMKDKKVSKDNVPISENDLMVNGPLTRLRESVKLDSKCIISPDYKTCTGSMHSNRLNTTSRIGGRKNPFVKPLKPKLVISAIRTLMPSDSAPVSSFANKKYIPHNSKVINVRRDKGELRRFFKEAIANDQLILTSGIGLKGSFTMPPTKPFEKHFEK